MPCRQLNDNIIICSPTITTQRRILHCPTCQRRRRFAVLIADWYDPIATCCACGDAWSAGERLPRPFTRSWRHEAAQRARTRWRTA